MERILVLLTVALVLAAIVVVSAMPAIAAPADKTISCITPDGGVIATSNEVPRRSEAEFIKQCESVGGTAERLSVSPNPGPEGTPPCCVPEDAKP